MAEMQEAWERFGFKPMEWSAPPTGKTGLWKAPGAEVAHVLSLPEEDVPEPTRGVQTPDALSLAFGKYGRREDIPASAFAQPAVPAEILIF